MTSGFAVRLATVEPVQHLVGLAVRAERLGAAAVLVDQDGPGRAVVVAVAAMAVATERIALLPRWGATTAAAVQRALPGLAALDELSGGRVVGCFPASGLRDGVAAGHAVAAVERRPRGPRPGLAGVVTEGPRPGRPGPGGWVVWSPPAVPDDLAGINPDAVAYRLERHDVEELDALVGRARAAGLAEAVDLLGVTADP
ncbi:MAG TPA: hypothetical protein VFU19_14110 [Iamia sp.]|nr:hypothetical protein [Iamia sp.]